MSRSRSNLSNFLLSGAGVSALCFAFATTASAQIDTIIVTAEKKEENVQDVSLSIQAFDEEGLEKGGVTDVSRLELLVSGVNFAFVGNDAKFNVRGANSTNTFGDNASIVGAYVDGVYKLRASQQTRAFFDVNRVEFLKGPQGTLYGRNTFAGALNLYTNAPDLEDLGAGFNVSYERFDRARADGYINLPISDTFAIRVAGFFDKSDGFVENLAGPNLGAQDDKGVRVSALWEPTERVSLLARYSNIQEDGREAGLFGYTFICRNTTPSGHTDPFGSVEDCANPNVGTNGAPSADELGPYTISQDFVPDAQVREQVWQLEANVDLGPVLFKSITAYTEFENLLGFDFDFSPNPFQVGGFNETAEYFTQEVQFSSNYDSRLQWTTGAYFSSDETDFNFFINSLRAADPRGGAVPVLDNSGNPVLDDMGMQLMLPLLVGTPLTSNDQILGGFFADATPLETTYFGLYGQFEFAVTDRLRLIGGVRYDNEDKELVGGGSNFTGDTDGDGIAEPPVVNVLPGGPFTDFSLDVEDVFGVFAIDPSADDAIRADPDASSNVSWRAGVEYDLGDNALLYVTASTGFLSGALNNSGSQTDDQQSRVIEAGVKSTLFNNSLLFNVAGHYTTYDNLLGQFQIPQTLPDGSTIVVTQAINGGEIEAFGVEVETVWVPVEGLQLGANLAFLDSEFKAFGQTNPYQLLNGQVQSFVDLAGEETPWSPDFTASLFGSYEFDIGEFGRLTPYVQFYYSDGYNTSNLLSIDPLQDQDSFTKTDLRLIWDAPDSWGNYSAEVFVENIENEAVLARGNNNGSDIVQTSFLYPRNFGVRFRADF